MFEDERAPRQQTSERAQNPQPASRDDTVVSAHRKRPTTPEMTGRPPHLPVLYRDRNFIAVSKPSGMLVHRSESTPDRIVVLQTLREQIGQFVYPVQRLDRGTSGVLVFGLSSKDAGHLQRALGHDDTAKEYLTLTRWPANAVSDTGDPIGEVWESRRPLRNLAGEPQPAHSEFSLIERVADRFALVRARIRTGRFRQIRRHLNHCARHVLGDTSHGKGRINAECRERFGLHRLFLHATRLRFVHPRNGAQIDIVDPLPPDLRRVLDALRHVIR